MGMRELKMRWGMIYYIRFHVTELKFFAHGMLL